MNTGNSARRKGKQREIFRFILLLFFLAESFAAILSRGLKGINKTCASRNFPPPPPPPFPPTPPLPVLLHRPPPTRSCAASRGDRGGIEEGSRRDRGRSHGKGELCAMAIPPRPELRTPCVPMGVPALWGERRRRGGDKRILGVSGRGDPLSTAPPPPSHPSDPVLPEARALLSACVSLFVTPEISDLPFAAKKIRN